MEHLFDDYHFQDCYIAGMPYLRMVCYQLDAFVMLYLPRLHDMFVLFLTRSNR